jgi:hypothetical protein
MHKSGSKQFMDSFEKPVDSIQDFLFAGYFAVFFFDKWSFVLITDL